MTLIKGGIRFGCLTPFRPFRVYGIGRYSFLPLSLLRRSVPRPGWGSLGVPGMFPKSRLVNPGDLGTRTIGTSLGFGRDGSYTVGRSDEF